MEQYYMLRLEEPAEPFYCSFDKKYIGTLAQIETAMEQLREDDPKSATVAAWDGFCAGNENVTHVVAHQEIPLLEPVEVLAGAEEKIGRRTWLHFNVWGSAYKMRFREATIRQIVIKHEDKYLRCIQAEMCNLKYFGLIQKWKLLKNQFWGNFFTMKAEKDGEFIKTSNILYMIEDELQDPAQASERVRDTLHLNFKCICDEIFADG